METIPYSNKHSNTDTYLYEDSDLFAENEL